MDHDPGAGFPLLFTTETAITYSSAWWTMPVLKKQKRDYMNEFYNGTCTLCSVGYSAVEFKENIQPSLL